LRVAREAKGLSMRQLAEKAGVTHSFVAKLEHGQYQSMGADMVTALAGPLDVPPEDLFTLAGYKVPARIEFVPTVVRSPSGKADYQWARSVLAAQK